MKPLETIIKYFPNASISEANVILNEQTNFLYDDEKEVEEQVKFYYKKLKREDPILFSKLTNRQ